MFTEKSWEKFEKCSLKRNDHIWLTMMNHWRGGPKGGYHRQCYQSYTNVGNISRIEGTANKAAPASANQEIAADEPSKEPPAKRFHRSHVQRLDIDKCIIRQVERCKRGKGARSREALIQNISEYGNASLLRAAEIRGDNRVLLQIKGQDCIAHEIKYHRSCYKNYVRLETLTKLEAQNCTTEDKESRGFSKAFGKLCNYLQSEVTIKKRILNMTELVGKFVSHLNEEGLNISDYRSSKLKQRLKGAFGKQLDFRKPSDPSQPELVYSANVEKGEIVESLVSHSDMTDGGLESGLEEIDEQDPRARKDIAHQVYHASKELRNLLLDVKPVLSWPPKADELQSDATLVPDMLYNMLAWILTSDTEFSTEWVTSLPNHVHCWILSLGQDLIHYVSRGRTKTPKHVPLPMTVKSLTGSAELVTLLNRFGHGLSYSQIEELETAIAEQQITNLRNGVLLPTVCSPSVSAVFCWDNNDLQEETLSGI